MTALVIPLPRDLEHGGMWLTQLYRSAREGGNIVYLENPPPGIAHGHKFHVFEIDVIEGKETLGLSLATKTNLDSAINVAAA